MTTDEIGKFFENYKKLELIALERGSNILNVTKGKCSVTINSYNIHVATYNNNVGLYDSIILEKEELGMSEEYWKQHVIILKNIKEKKDEDEKRESEQRERQYDEREFLRLKTKLGYE
mgnify:FL=1